ncbi:MAG: SpaA isopeptide-forming pilin-related protein, partial [Acutalibacteraceae bacterium]
VALSGLKQYSYSETGNTFVEGTADWELTADEKYTIYEYGYSDAYLFKAFGKNDSSNYTFTYLPATVQNFVCENILKTWQVSVVKKDVDDENIKLQGAVFGLYSTDAADEISDTDLADLVTGFGLSSTPSKTETVTIDGTPTTVYLKDISSTDELGVVSWTDLINSKYAVKELKAPDGYLINEDESNPNLRLISQPAVISLDSYTSVASYTNKTYYNLPKTGGVGTSLFYIIGALLIASSVIFYVYGKRRKCERGVKK